MDMNQQLQAVVDDAQRPLAGLAAGIVKHGRLVYEGYFGRRYIDCENAAHDLPITAATKFRVASISKLVATVGLLRLVEQGAADLDADVSDYLPFTLRNPYFPEVPITLRTLLTHTSSIRDATAYTIPIPQTLEAFFFEGSPFFEEGAHWATHAPGEFFRYCNLNFGVMATAVETITGQRFDEYMQTAVLRPLGLTAAYNVAQLPDDEIGHIAALYRKMEGGLWNPQGRWVAQADDYRGVKPRPLAQLENPDVQADFEAKFGRPQLPQELDAYRLGTNGTLFSPQGGLRISLPDLARLMQMFLRGGEPLLRPETVRLMLSEQWRYDGSVPNGDSFSGLMRSWGLSVHRFTHSGTAGDGDKLLADRPLCLVGHLGEAYGLLSGFLFDPAAQHGLIYVLNGVSADPLTYDGRYSSFSRWEEKILTILGDELLAD